MKSGLVQANMTALYLRRYCGVAFVAAVVLQLGTAMDYIHTFSHKLET